MCNGMIILNCGVGIVLFWLNIKIECYEWVVIDFVVYIYLVYDWDFLSFLKKCFIKMNFIWVFCDVDVIRNI